MKTKKPIGQALTVLETNLPAIGQIRDWAELMGYTNTKLFSRHFLRHYKIRPCVKLNEYRVASIVDHLKDGIMTYDEIAWAHCLADSKGLNKFMNYHTGFSPSKIKSLPDNELELFMKYLFGKIWEKN